MRVVQVVPQFTKGGAEKLALDMHRFLLSEGVESHLLALSGEGLDEPGCVPLRALHPRSPQCLWRLRGWLKRRQDRGAMPDIVHTHLFPDQFWAPLAVRGFKRPPVLVTTEHNETSRRRSVPFGQWIDAFLYGKYRQIYCVSVAAHDSLRAWQPLLADRLVTIRNGVDLERVLPWQGTPGSMPKRILSVGRLCEQKNQPCMVEAMARLSDLPCELVIVGEGPLEGRLRDQISRLNLQDRVHLLGWRDDVEKLLSESDVFLLPSEFEGFGLAAVEAMAAGVPVVATNIAPFREVLGTDGTCAVLVERGDVDAIADAMRGLLCDDARRHAMGRAAKDRARDFGLPAMRRAYLEAYRHLTTADR